MKTLALSLLLPVLVGPLTFALMQGIKRLSSLVDAQSPLTKRVAVAAIAFALTLVAKLTGVELPGCEDGVNCLALLDHDAVKAVVSAALAFGLHALKASTKAKEG